MVHVWQSKAGITGGTNHFVVINSSRKKSLYAFADSAKSPVDGHIFLPSSLYSIPFYDVGSGTSIFYKVRKGGPRKITFYKK